MTGKFPIANMLRRGDPIHSFQGYGSGMAQHDKVAKWIGHEGTAFIDIQVAADLYWTGSKNYYALDKDFGPMRPPYDVCWAEWTTPRHTIVEGKPFDFGYEMHVGAFVPTAMYNTADLPVEQIRRDASGWAGVYPDYYQWGDRQVAPLGYSEATITNGSFELLVNRMHRDARDILMMAIVVYILDPSTGELIFIPFGRNIGMDPRTGQFCGFAMDLIPQDEDVPDKVLKQAKAASDINPILLAMSLTNCKNVTTRKAGPVFTRSGREKRQGYQSPRYTTIGPARHELSP